MKTFSNSKSLLSSWNQSKRLKEELKNWKISELVLRDIKKLSLKSPDVSKFKSRQLRKTELNRQIEAHNHLWRDKVLLMMTNLWCLVAEMEDNQLVPLCQLDSTAWVTQINTVHWTQNLKQELLKEMKKLSIMKSNLLNYKVISKEDKPMVIIVQQRHRKK